TFSEAQRVYVTIGEMSNCSSRHQNPLSLGAELVDRSLSVFLTRSEYYGGELGFIDRIGEVLRFQAEAVILLVGDPLLPALLAVQEVARVQLHAWFGGQHLHHAAGLRLVHAGA